MKHEELKYLLPDYINGALSDPEKVEVQRMLDQDPALREEYNRLLPVMQLMHEERAIPVQSAALSRLLVHVNDEIDRQKRRHLFDFVPFRIFVPAGGLAVVIASFFLLMSPQSDDILPGGTSATIEETLVLTDPDPLAQIRIQTPDDILLSDLSLDNAVVVLSGEEETAFIAAVHEEMFENIAYKEFLAASNEYLSTDDVLRSLTTKSASELLEQLDGKSIL